METDKILSMYVTFAADMFCNFSGHTNIVSDIVVNDSIHVEFYNSPMYRSFDVDIAFNVPMSVEEQILQAFDRRLEA